MSQNNTKSQTACQPINRFGSCGTVWPFFKGRLSMGASARLRESKSLQSQRLAGLLIGWPVLITVLLTCYDRFINQNTSDSIAKLSAITAIPAFTVSWSVLLALLALTGFGAIFSIAVGFQSPWFIASSLYQRSSLG